MRTFSGHIIVRVRAAAESYGTETEVDLSVLTNLQSLNLRHHNIASIHETLSQLNDCNSSLESLTIEIVRWKLGMLPYEDCGRCDYPQLAGKLGTLLGGPVFKKVPLHLRVPERFLEPPDLVETLKRGREPGSTQVSKVDEDGYMVDSMDTLAGRILSRLRR